MTLLSADTGNIVTIAISVLVIGYILYSFLKAKRLINKPPSDKIQILTDQNFENATRKGVSLVDFWAPWCGPCRIQGPIIDEIADEYSHQAAICKMNVDEHQTIARKFGIQNIPTILILKDGKPIERLVGLKSKSYLVKALQAHI